MVECANKALFIALRVKTSIFLQQLKKAGVSPGVLPKSTSVTKIPSLSRVGAPAAIQVAVAGQDSLEITVTREFRSLQS